MDDKTIEDEQVLLVIFAPQLAELMKRNALLKHIEGYQIKLTGKRIALLVCGLADYMSTNRWLVRMNVEKALTRLQLFAGISHRLLDTPHDLAITVVLFTKAVAEAPYKLVFG